MDERRNQTRKMPTHRDGVAYIPGGHSLPPEANLGKTKKITFVDATGNDFVPEPTPIPTGPKIPPKKKIAPAKNTNYSIVMIAVVAVLGLAAVFVFATMFTGWLENTSGPGSGSMVTGDAGSNLPGGDLPPLESIAPPVAAPGSIAATGLIRDIRSNRLDIYVFDIGEIRSFFIEPHSTLRDRVGSPAILPQFAVGDVVYISHAPTSNTAESVQLSAQIRHHRYITGITIEDDQQLVIGNRRYDLGDNPIIRYNGQTLNLSELDPIDLVTVATFQDNFVTSIEVLRSHGDVLIPANEEILNGTVEVGTTVFSALGEEEQTIRIPSGQNRVVIRGENIEPFIFDVSISRGQVSNLSFDGLEFRAGLITINTETENAILHIGDRWHPTNEPITLEFGEYELRLEAIGYHSVYQTITIGTQPQEITINLDIVARTRNVIITTSPSEVRVYLDDQFRGLTPLSTELELGRYALTLEREGFMPVTTNIQITEDSNTIFSYILANDPAWVTFE